MSLMPTKDRTTKSHPPGSDPQRGCDQFCWRPWNPAAAAAAARDAVQERVRFCSTLLCPSTATRQDMCGDSSCRPKARDQVLANIYECVLCTRTCGCAEGWGWVGTHPVGPAESRACIPPGRKESSESAVPWFPFFSGTFLPPLPLALRGLPKSVPREMPSWPRDSVTRFSSELRS